MKVTINTKHDSQSLREYPILLIHTGTAGGGDESWKDTIVLATAPSSGIIMKSGKGLDDKKIVGSNGFMYMDATAPYWTPFSGSITLSN